MEIKHITDKDKNTFNQVISHPLQSYEWGEFREKTGIKVIRKGFFDKDKLISGFQLTIHKIPRTPWTVGYLPKGDLPTKELINVLKQIGKQENCIFIQLEPNVIKSINNELIGNKTLNSHLSVLNSLKPAVHPLFTKYDFILDLTKSEEELLKNLHHKTRYNIKIAQKHGVQIIEDNSPEAFEEYLRLTKETTTRQKFYAHTERYHRIMWQTLKTTNTNIEFRISCFGFRKADCSSLHSQISRKNSRCLDSLHF